PDRRRDRQPQPAGDPGERAGDLGVPRHDALHRAPERDGLHHDRQRAAARGAAAPHEGGAEVPMSPTAPAEVVTDLADPVMFTDPWPRYAALRRTAPVSRVRSKQLLRGGGGMGYLVTRYDDVLQVHTDPRLSSDLLAHTRAGSFMRFAPRVMRLLTDSMVFKDDPDHKRLRGLVNKAFTPKRVAQMSEHIEKVVHELLDEIGRRDE